MAWKALVPPRLDTQDATGMCLRFAQSFFGAPVRYNSAWDAWQATQAKYAPSDPLPDVPVLLWFEHWGSYGDPLTYANWGHVAAYVPGDAIYTSPTYGYGQQRYGTIAEIEQAFNCRYVGWSPDIIGLLVADWTAPTPIVEDDMFSDADRALLTRIGKDTARIKAIYDALFKTDPTSLGTRGGVLKTLKAIDDALFKPTETSLGTPGGVLVSLREVIATLDELKGALDADTIVERSE